MGGPEFFSSIQQAIGQMMRTSEPAFLSFGHAFFLSLAIVVLSWTGITLMLQSGALNDKIFVFVKTLLFVSIGYAMIAFYEAPIPGFGVSFSNLITDQAAYFANTLDAGAVSSVYEHLDGMFNRFVAPGLWEGVAPLIYLVLVVTMVVAKALTLAIVGFGFIASAVFGLLGPIFVPFFIVPKLDFLFWGWLRGFIQWSFMPVVAYAYLMVFDRFLFTVLTSLPNGISADLYLVYGLQVVTILLIFVVGIIGIPYLTSSLFSGGGGGLSILDRLIRR